MEEIVITWKPLPILQSNYNIQSISTSINNGFKIMLVDKENENRAISLSLEFPPDALRYRKLNTVRTLISLPSQEGPFFKLANSNYVKKLVNGSLGIHSEKAFTHYIIVATENIIEIVSAIEPLVEIVQKQNEQI